jgi:hypothetical protein
LLSLPLVFWLLLSYFVITVLIGIIAISSMRNSSATDRHNNLVVKGLTLESLMMTFGAEENVEEEDHFSTYSPRGIANISSRPQSACHAKSIPFLAKDIQVCNDLLIKNNLLVNNPAAAKLFVKYAFFGSWIFPLMEVSPSRPAPERILSSTVMPEELRADAYFEGVGANNTDPMISVENKTYGILKNLLGDIQLNYLGLAVALQQFCRSEVFMAASESNWDVDVVNQIVVRSYLTERNVTKLLRTCHQSTEGFLDDLFFHLHRFTNYSRDAHDLFTNHNWIFALEHVLNIMPFAMKVESSHPMQACGWNIDYLNEQSAWGAGYTSQTIPQDTRSRMFSAPYIRRANDLLYSLHTGTTTTHLILPFISSQEGFIGKQRSGFDFLAVTPVLRSPLIQMKGDEMVVTPSNYDWSLFQVVTVQWEFLSEQHELDTHYLAVTSDLSFVLAHIVG